MIGSVGATYSFAEKDALSEIEARAKQIDWQAAFAHIKKQGMNFKPKDAKKLPKAERHLVRQVDMTYTLDVDIPDPKNPSRILYPRGFSFNPLQYATLPVQMVFIDTSDRRQMKWLKSSPLAADPLTVVALTGGDVEKTEKLIGRAVFFADSVLGDRFDIRVVPSIARQNGLIMEVEEIYVGKNTTGSR